VRERPSDELGEVLGEPVGTQLQRSIGSRIQISFQLALDPYRFYCLGDVRRYDLPGHRSF
jgi:hypothetical protein